MAKEEWRVTDARAYGVLEAISPGYAVSSEFHVEAHRTVGLADLRADIEVRVEKDPDGRPRARATKLTLSTEGSTGVNSTALRVVEIRNLIAEGMAKVLTKVELTKDSAKTTQMQKPDEEGWAAIRAAVRYVEGKP